MERDKGRKKKKKKRDKFYRNIDDVITMLRETEYSRCGSFIRAKLYKAKSFVLRKGSTLKFESHCFSTKRKRDAGRSRNAGKRRYGFYRNVVNIFIRIFSSNKITLARLNESLFFKKKIFICIYI